MIMGNNIEMRFTRATHRAMFCRISSQGNSSQEDMSPYPETSFLLRGDKPSKLLLTACLINRENTNFQV